MAMVGGSVSVDSSGTATGSGLALAMYNAEAGTMTSDTNWSSYSLAARVQALRGIAARWTAIAPALVTYLQANAVAHVTSQSLGAVPSSTAHGTPIDAPAAPVDIPIT